MKRFRASFLHLRNSSDLEWVADGCLTVNAAGTIENLEPWHPEFEKGECIDFSGQIVIPGLIDAHVHFPQIGAMGAYGEELLSWLERYIFPAEKAFADKIFAAEMAEVFWKTLFRHGTTFAAVFSSSHTAATQVLLEAADRLGACGIIGKTLMDRHAPAELLESADQACGAAEELCQQWASHGRLSYAFTPRFAPACSDELLRKVGALVARYPKAYVQSHLSENRKEIEWVKTLFPKASSYTDVYSEFGLLGPKTIMGHGVWLSENELKTLSQTKTTIAHCPVSNHFLGSGLFELRRAKDQGCSVALGSDVAGGNTFSMLRVMDATYKTAALVGAPVGPRENFALATLAGAEALGVGNAMGNFAPGKMANFAVLDLSAISEAELRGPEGADEVLSTLIHLGDERMVKQTYISGQRVY